MKMSDFTSDPGLGLGIGDHGLATGNSGFGIRIGIRGSGFATTIIDLSARAPGWSPASPRSRSSTPRMVPACITAMRSLMPRISGQLRRDHDDRQAAFGQRLHQRVDLRLRPDVHALRRLVEDEDRGPDRQPARERDLLLVAARQRADLVAADGALMRNCSM